MRAISPAPQALERTTRVLVVSTCALCERPRGCRGATDPSRVELRTANAVTAAAGTQPQHQIDAIRAALLRQREHDLRALSERRFRDMTSAATPVTEDLTRQPKAYLMAYTGSTIGSRDADVDTEYVEAFARIGAQEGFGVVEADFYPEGPQRRTRANIETVRVPFDSVSAWMEDRGQVAVDGQVTVPPPRPSGTAPQAQAFVSRAIDAHRARRAAAARRSGVELAFGGSQGGVWGRGEENMRLMFGLATRRRIRIDLCYLERGNVLLGQGSRGTYALVGSDSMGLSRATLEGSFEALGIERGRLDDDMVRIAIANDIGVEPRNVIEVEQAAGFHIDMSMTPWTSGVVLLNDMAQVEDTMRRTFQARGMSAASQQLARGRARLLQIAATERITERQLRAAGLRVVRAPGKFPALPEDNWRTNFFNGEGGSGTAGRGPYWITQDGPAAYKDAFESALRRGGVTVPRMYHVPADSSRDSLGAQGGANCRAVPLMTGPRP